jgi:EAL domain-containing protein (putative c-di-GMP-specific phosphodiesterase class I)
MRTRWLTSLNITKPSWICLTIDPEALSAPVDSALRKIGLTPLDGSQHCYATQSREMWNVPWRHIESCLTAHRLAPATQVSIHVDEIRPTLEDVALHLRSVEDTTKMSEQMWLIDAIENKRLTCHFQPVIDRRGEIFGQESLVRAMSEDGKLISGAAIFKASRVLGIEHLIDRHLHELAIKCYTQNNLTGFLFINLVPGFIQRPEFYFGGLGEAARQYGMHARNIVLDCTNSEKPRDIQQLKSITQYCRSQGYLVSLDDIASPETARRILKEMHPDFIKLDMHLAQQADRPEVMDIIHEMVDLTRNSPCSLIAEGVETEAMRALLEQAEIGLFQGYLFSQAPADVGATSKKTITSRKKSTPRN